MKRWQLIVGFVLLGWLLAGVVLYRQLRRDNARELLTSLSTTSDPLALTHLDGIKDKSRSFYPNLVSRPCLKAVKRLHAHPWPAPDLKHAAAVCPRGAQPLPPDLLLVEQILPPEELSFINGILETLAALAGPGAPPTEPVLRDLVLRLSVQRQTSSQEWPERSESYGLPTDTAQYIEEATRACLTAELERYGDLMVAPVLRAEILWHPRTGPMVVRSESPAGYTNLQWSPETKPWVTTKRTTSWYICLRLAAEKVPTPDGLARFIWIGEE